MTWPSPLMAASISPDRPYRNASREPEFPLRSFPLLGAQAMLGRVFTTEEDGKGSAPAAILTYGFWQRHFAGDRAVIGKTLTLDGNAVTIIGVMQPEFSLNKEVMPTVNKINNADFAIALADDGNNARDAFT